MVMSRVVMSVRVYCESVQHIIVAVRLTFC